MLCRVLNIPLYVTRPLRLLTALTHALDVLIKCFYEFSVNHVVFLWIFCIFLETELTGHAPLHSLLWNHRTLGDLFAITSSICKCFFFNFCFLCLFLFFMLFLGRSFSRNSLQNCQEVYPINWFRSDAAVRKCSVKKVFLVISQNSRENTCARVSFLIKLQA